MTGNWKLIYYSRRMWGIKTQTKPQINIFSRFYVQIVQHALCCKFQAILVYNKLLNQSLSTGDHIHYNLYYIFQKRLFLRLWIHDATHKSIWVGFLFKWCPFAPYTPHQNHLSISSNLNIVDIIVLSVLCNISMLFKGSVKAVTAIQSWQTKHHLVAE